MHTTNPVPSSDPSDLVFNAEKLDQVVNSTATTFTDRLGTVRKTINGVMSPLQDAATEAIDTDIPALVGDVQTARNTAINTTIPGLVAQVSESVAATYVGQAGARADDAQAAQAAAELARDAALVGAGVYATEAAGLAAVSDGDAFKVQGSGNAAAYEYRKRTSPNLYNAATKRPGFYLNGGANGAIQAATGWGITDFIPVTAGQQYTISFVARRGGVSFFTAASDAALIVGSYSISASNPLTLTAPVGATHIVVALYSTTVAESNVQVEAGALATAYRAFGSTYSELLAAYPSVGSVTELDSRVGVIEDYVGSILPNYVRNFLPNGDLASASPAWTYTGTSPIVTVSGIPELSGLGIDSAYSIPTAGGTASQVRIEGALLTEIGVASGDHLLLGSFVYASDGSSFPSSFASYSIQVGVATLAMDSTGFVQVSPNVCFLWAKKLVPSGSLTRIIVGFTSGFLPAAAATRLHTGFFLHKSSVSADTPTLATINSYIGWEGQAPSSEFISDARQVVADYPDLTARVASLEAEYSPKLVLAGAGDSVSYVEVQRQGKTIRRSFRPFPIASKTASSVFDFRADAVDGLTIKSMSDDAAPYRALGTTIGANHGYFMFSVPAAGHGKTQADIGGVYSNAGVQWVIISIIDSATLHIARRSDNASTVAPSGTYAHVSGGSSTSTFTVTAAGTLAQLYPPFANRSMQCLVDGVQVADTTADLRYKNTVAFVESYDILERADVIAWYEASGSSGAVQPTGAPAISVSISYVFDHEGQCTIYTDFMARKNGIALSDIMFLQAQRMTTGVDGAVEYYIPKALPVTQNGVTYDYANIDATDTSAWSTRLDFTPARCEPTGILCDRLVQLTNNYGFAMGYLPVQSTSLSARRSNATVKALQISNSSAKVYLSAIDKGNITLNSGDYFSTIGYRNIVLRESARTSMYVVRTNGADYMYLDWHTTTTDRVPVPSDFVGREFEVVEKSANVTVLSQALTSSLLVSVAAAGGYGYLILKVLK